MPQALQQHRTIPDRRCFDRTCACRIRCESCPAVLSKSRRPTLHRQRRAHSRSPEPAATSWPACAPKSSSQVEPTPAKYLVRVDAMRRATRATDAPSTNVSRQSPLLRDIARCRGAAPNDSLLSLSRWNCRKCHLRPSGRLSGVSTSGE